MRTVGIGILVAVVSLALGAPAAARRPPATQVTLFSGAYLHEGEGYLTPELAGPTSWTAPVDFARGRLFLRVEVTSKPTTKPVGVQLCMWRDRYVEETCSRTTTFTRRQELWVDLGTPANWWSKGRWSWATAWDPTRLMLKDVASGLLMNRTKCSPYCYPGNDLAAHLPIRLRATAVLVARGADLDPPRGWGSCPKTWSPRCRG